MIICVAEIYNFVQKSITEHRFRERYKLRCLLRKEVILMKKTLTVVLSLIFILAFLSVTVKAEKDETTDVMKIRGKITEVDANAMTITVKGKKRSVKVTVDDKTEFKLGKDKKAITDLKVGDKVKIFFQEADDKNIAKSIEEHIKK